MQVKFDSDFIGSELTVQKESDGIAVTTESQHYVISYLYLLNREIKLRK